MKETAVQFLLKRIKNDIGRSNSENEYQAGYKQCLIDLQHFIEIQTFEMEKRQIMEAFDEGQDYEYDHHVNAYPRFYSESYYNETYSK